MEKDDILVALSALSSETRKKMYDELAKAIGDTAMEYHRTYDKDIMRMLYEEIKCMCDFKDLVSEAQRDFSALDDDPNSDHGGTPQLEDQQ